MANADVSDVHHSTHPAEIMVRIRAQKFMVMKVEGFEGISKNLVAESPVDFLWVK